MDRTLLPNLRSIRCVVVRCKCYKTPTKLSNAGNVKPVLYNAGSFVSFVRSSVLERILWNHSVATFTTGTQEKNSKDWQKKTVVIGAGSAVAAVSLFTLWYSGIFSKKKHSLETPVRDIKKQTKLKIPEKSADIPNKIQYLLVGGGTASFSAFRAIKSGHPTAKVLVISDEPYYPYMRPPLTKELWFGESDESTKNLNFTQWNGKERSVFYEPEDFYVSCSDLENESKGGVAVARGWTVTSIDPLRKIARLDDGKEIQYGKCLIATGSQAKNLPVFEEGGEEIGDKVTLFRNIDDFLKLYDIVTMGAKSIAVIGSGIAGSELACALVTKGKHTGMKVTQVFLENGNMGKILPSYLSTWVTKKIRNANVNVLNNTEIQKVSLTPNKRQLVLQFTNGNQLIVDHAVLAVGLEPNIQLAKTAGLETDPNLGGLLVNAELVARSDIFSAGDCASYYDRLLGRRRLAHHDHAVVTGRLAGENMVGEGIGKPYWQQSMFWSDIGSDIGYEAVGIIDSSLPTVGVFAKPSSDSKDKNENKSKDDNLSTSETNLPLSTSTPKEGEEYNKGVVFYLRDDIIVGIVLWNLFSRMTLARQILKQGKKFEDLNEVAKLFNIHAE